MKLSEMKKSPDVGLPETTFKICVSGKLIKELVDSDAIMFDLLDQVAALEAKKAKDEGDRPEGSRGGRRVGQKGNAGAIADLKAQAAAQAEISDAIRDRMEATTIELHLVGQPEGQWRQFRDAHPARSDEDDPAGWDRDRKWAAGYVNIDDVIASAGDWVAMYGEEEPADGSWDFIAANAAPGDLTKLASKIVGLHETGVDLGKSRRTWLDDQSGDVS